MERRKVAVIGAGCLALATIKNLLEEGFEVVAFERNNHVGGMWRFQKDEHKTSGTNSTTWNGSQQSSAYTDFPFPKDYPDHPNLSQIEAYLRSYCDHFGLNEHIRLGCEVKHITRTEDDKRWTIEYIEKEGRKREEFDRIAYATGQVNKPHIPRDIAGLQNFNGQTIHSQSYKGPDGFKDKIVLVLGSSNTAIDAVCDLNGVAKKVYLSHRTGGVITPRIYKGVPFEYVITPRLQAIGRYISYFSPALFANMLHNQRLKMSNETFGKIPPKWRFNMLYYGRRLNPIINDDIIGVLREGHTPVVHGIRRVLESGTIELSDGIVLSDIDVIILCTGYTYDFSLLAPHLNPNNNQHPEWLSAGKSEMKPLPNLYHGFISLDYPDSLVFIGASSFLAGQIPMWDLASMAVAQLWKGAYPIPSRGEMEAELADRRAWLTAIAKRPGPQTLFNELRPVPFFDFCHKVAGTGVDTKLGYGIEGWWFWFTHRQLCNTLMKSLPTPHLFRLFDGRRKKWDGAEAEILRVNTDADARRKAYADGQSKKTQ